MTKKIIYIFLIAFFLFPVRSYGQHFSSTDYNIDWGNFNMTSGKKTSTNYSLTDTIGQNAPGEYSKTGVKLKSGFQYIYPFDQFSFTIDNLNINFGNLSLGVATTATSNLTITSPGGHGFQISTFENSRLRYINSYIPDFTGDNNLASESVSDTWNNSSTYGFGLHANTSYFASVNHYRQFADSSLSEKPQIIDSSVNSVKNHQTTITYKINSPPNQSAGVYQNYIVYIATPNY